MTAKKVYYFFDESGEKGFISPGVTSEPFGLIAGYAFPASAFSKIENNLKNIFAELDCSDINKLHATEVFKNDKNRHVREQFFDYFDGISELLIIYEAIYPQGVFKYNQSIKEVKPELNSRDRKPTSSPVHFACRWAMEMVQFSW